LADGRDSVLGALRGTLAARTEFHYERPANLPSFKPLQNWPKFNPRNLR
jgi:hypothetical protein